MRENGDLIIANGSMTSTITGSIYDMEQSYGYAAAFQWTGTPTGTVKIQQSLDQILWFDVAASSQATGGLSGTFYYENPTSMALFVRPVFVFSSGTGTLNVTMAKKGF